jgi:predicted nucleic acid-binding protein
MKIEVEPKRFTYVILELDPVNEAPIISRMWNIRIEYWLTVFDSTGDGELIFDRRWYWQVD